MIACLVGGGVCLLSAPSLTWPEEATTQQQVTVRKTKDGLHFNVPSDWPVENRGGITAPIPIEEYLAQKFKALGAQLQVLEQRLNSLDVRLRLLEEASKRQTQGLKSTEPAIPATAPP